MVGKVIFPKHFEKMKISDKLSNFFLSNSISITASSFDLELLRIIFYIDNKLFNYLKFELELKGFNFKSENDSFFVKEIDFNNYQYIISESKGAISPLHLNKLGLWNIFSKIGIYERDYINYIPLERLTHFSNSPFNLVTQLIESNFKIIKEEIKNELPNVLDFNHSIKKSFDLMYTAPRFIVNFLSSIRKVPSNLFDFIKMMGYVTIESILNLGFSNVENIITKAYNRFGYNCYSINVMELILVKFINDKNDYYSKLQKFGLHLKNHNNFEINVTSENKKEFNQFLDEYYYWYISNFDLDIETNSFKNIGLYPLEKKFIKRIGLNNLDDILNLRIDTKLDIFRANNYLLIDYLYEFREIIEKISFVISNDQQNHDYINYENNYKILKFDLYLDSLFNKVIQKNQNKIDILDIIRKREVNYTLDELGQNYGLTRERIRQVEKRFLEKYNNDYIKIISYIFSFNKCVPEDIILLVPGVRLIIGKDKNYLLVKDLGVIMHSTMHAFLYNKISYIDYSVINIRNMYNKIEKKTGILLNAYFNYIYKSGTIRKIGLKDIGSNYLKYRKKQGFLMSKDLDDARCYFENNGRKNVSDSSLQNNIAGNTNAVLVDMGKYLHIDYINEEKYYIVKGILENFEFDKFGNYAREIYFKNKEILNKIGIDNYYFLYGIIRIVNDRIENDQRKYLLSGRSMRVTKENLLSIDEIISEYLEQRNGFSDISQTKKDLNITDITIEQSKVALKYDKKTIVLKKVLSLNCQEKIILRQFIKEDIDNHSFCHPKDLIEKIFFDDLNNRILIRNEIKESKRLYIFLKFFYSEEFNFCSSSLAISDLNNKAFLKIDILVELFKNKVFSKEDVNNIADRYSISYWPISNFINDYSVPIDNNKYILKENVDYKDGQIEFIIQEINKKFNDDTYILSSDIVSILKLSNISSEYVFEPLKLISYIDLFPGSKWKKIINDIQMYNLNIENLLINTSNMIEGNHSASEFIKSFIFQKEKGYVTYDKINNILLDYEIIKSDISDKYLKTIFNDYEEHNLVRVVK